MSVINTDKYLENLKQASGAWNLSIGTPPKCFSTILCLVALDSQTNTVISHTFAYSSRWRRKPWQGLYVETLKNESVNKVTKLFRYTAVQDSSAPGVAHNQAAYYTKFRPSAFALITSNTLVFHHNAPFSHEDVCSLPEKATHWCKGFAAPV